VTVVTKFKCMAVNGIDSCWSEPMWMMGFRGYEVVTIVSLVYEKLPRQ